MQYDICTTPNFHLGKEIEARIDEVGITKAEFGRRINMQRGNVNSLLTRRDCPAERLLLISKVLKKNFFESPIQEIAIEEDLQEEEEADSETAHPTTLTSNLQRLIETLESIQAQL